MSDIRTRIDRIIQDCLGADPREIKPEASFITDLRADSLDTLELVFELENEFGIQLSDDQAEHMQTVGEAYQVIEKMMQEAAA